MNDHEIKSLKYGDVIAVECDSYKFVFVLRCITSRRYDQFNDMWTYYITTIVSADSRIGIGRELDPSFVFDDKSCSFRYATEEEKNWLYECVKDSKYGEICRIVRSLKNE